MRKLGIAGDTIVEVLICISVVSLVLGGAFASSNRSLNATSQAKERDQGVRLAETQIEQLKSAIKDPAKAITTDPDRYFCLSSSNRVDFSGSVPSDFNADNLATPPYPGSCVVTSYNTTYNSSDNSIPYYVSIERDSSDENYFTARVRWFRAGGNGREEASLVYRTYQ